MNPGHIYLLLHPLTKEIRYVGYTENIIRRYRDHINDALRVIDGRLLRKKNTPKNLWVVSLMKNELKPEMICVDSFTWETKDTWSRIERFWIKYYRERGHRLLNLMDGGDGNKTNIGRKFGPVPPERLKKISDAVKLAMNKPEVREKCRLGGMWHRGRKCKPEHVQQRLDTRKRLNEEEPERKRKFILALLRRSGKIICYHLCNGTLSIFETFDDLEKILGVKQGAVQAGIRLKRIVAKKYVFLREHDTRPYK